MLVLMIFVNSIDAYTKADTNVIMVAMIFIEVLTSGMVPTSIQHLSPNHQPYFKSAAGIDDDIDVDADNFCQY